MERSEFFWRQSARAMDDGVGLTTISQAVPAEAHVVAVSDDDGLWQTLDTGLSAMLSGRAPPILLGVRVLVLHGL